MKLVASGKAKKEDDHLDGMIIQYLYMRSFAPVDRPTEANWLLSGSGHKILVEKRHL
ncbi:MAG: hypothetical protein R2778_04510 [Saprospiraceae bacterium]